MVEERSGRGRPIGSKELWPDREIEEVKAKVRADLGRFETQEKRGQRLKLALQRIQENSRDLDSSTQLSCYVYIISALVHHERWGGLQARQIKKLAEHATGILRVQGVKLSSRRLSSLYGDLHLVLSQINRKFGESWQAAWQQQMAARLIKNNQSRDHSFLVLGEAIRNVRLGFSDAALRGYHEALRNAAPESSTRLKALLGLCKTARLAGQFEESQAYMQQILTIARLPDSARVELDWERICLEAQRSQNLESLVKSVRRGQPHYQGVYILEAFLWARSAPSLNLTDWLSTLSTYKRNKDLRLPFLGAINDFVTILEDCYDTGLDFYLRLQTLGDILTKRSQFISIEQELLALVASARFLARNNAYGLASLCLAQYEQLSYSLSLRRTGDVLGVAGDMLQKGWHIGRDEEDSLPHSA